MDLNFRNLVCCQNYKLRIQMQAILMVNPRLQKGLKILQHQFFKTVLAEF